MSLAVCGNIVDSAADWSLRAENDGILVVDEGGFIRFRGSGLTESDKSRLLEKYSVDEVVNLDNREFVMPGLIDSHIHAPQFPNAGLGLDKPLLEWLETYTYPTETRFEDAGFAGRVYEAAVEATLSHGTTSAAYYATLHREASEILCDVCEVKGQRALVGKVSMHR